MGNDGRLVSCMPSLRHIGNYLLFNELIFGDPTDGLMYRDRGLGNIKKNVNCIHVSKKIFGDGCAGSNCMDTGVARPIT